jgi:hypothetical protein
MGRGMFRNDLGVSDRLVLIGTMPGMIYSLVNLPV